MAARSKCGATAPPCAGTTYVDDMVDGVYRLMQSGLEGPVNIGHAENVTVESWFGRWSMLPVRMLNSPRQGPSRGPVS